MKNVRCNLCNSTEASLCFSIDKYKIYKCHACSFVFVFPRFSSKKLSDYYKNFKANIFEKSKITYTDSLRTLKKLRKYLGKENNRLLDVGCGNGIFARLAVSQGWSVVGVEISKKLARFLSKDSAFKVIQGNILNLKFSESFNMITLNQVIEHFSEPGILIKRCHSLLQSNGLLYIATPNIDSLSSKIRKEDFDYMMPPEHLSYFNRNTLIRLLRQEKFKILAYSTWSYSVDLAGLIKYFLRKGNNKKNLQKKQDTRLVNNKTFIKQLKYLMFDKVFCGIFYRILNIEYQGTMLEVIAQKQ